MNRALLRFIVRTLSVTPAPECSGDHPEPCSESAWRSSLAWLDSSGLSLYFWQRVTELGWQQLLPPPTRLCLDDRRSENSRRTSAMYEEFARCIRLFDKAGARHAVLKGPALVPEYCSDLSLRLQYDHDFLVNPHSLASIEKVLHGAGYHRKSLREHDRVVYAPPFPPRRGFPAPSDCYSAGLPRSVELHLKLWDPDEEKIPLSMPEDLLARSSTHTRAGLGFPVLSDEDMLLFAALHAFRHILHNWCRLSVLLEIAHFLQGRRENELFWLRFKARVDQHLRLRQITGVIFTLAARLFNSPYPPRGIEPSWFCLTSELELWIARYGKESALQNFSSDKLSLLLFQQFVADRAGWREIRNRRLFPLHGSHCLRPTQTGHRRPSTLEVCGQAAPILRRLLFHLRTALRYAWEIPKWERLVRRARAQRPGTPERVAAKSLPEKAGKGSFTLRATIPVSELGAARGGTWKSE